MYKRRFSNSGKGNMGVIRQILTVIHKELLDTRRDLKAIMPALMMPLFFAAMTFGTIQFVVSVQDQPQTFELAVAGADRAAPLMQSLREAGMDIIEAPADPVAAVSNRDLNMVLVVPDDFNERFRAQKHANLDLVWDISRTDSHAKVSRVKNQLNQWAAATGSLRLLSRGVSPEVSQVLKINDVNVASDQKMASKILGAIPMVILLLAFVTGAGMSSEMAAGERENKTLEPVLITPISHTTLFLGKWATALAVTFVFALLGVALQLVSVNAAPLEQLGLRSQLNLSDFVAIMLVLVPVMILATALQLLVSFLSKSFKDAQSYNQLLMFLPVIPGVYILLSGAGFEAWKMWVPLLGSQLLIVEIFSGQAVPLIAGAIAGLTSLSCAALFAFIAVRLMKREG